MLSGRLNLPTGFGPSGYEKRKDQTQSQRTLESPSASSVAAAAVRHNGRDERLGEIAEGEEEQEEEDGSDNENSRKSGDEDDDSFDGKYSIIFVFVLPAGTFALADWLYWCLYYSFIDF